MLKILKCQKNIDSVLLCRLLNVVGNDSIRKYSNQAKVFSKFLNRGNKKRTWHNYEFQHSPGIPPPQSITKGPQSKKRVDVLNKLFMKHITDLMASGECSDQILGQGIEVTKVKVGSEYNIVNVYWTCHKEHLENETSRLLCQVASNLRHELSSLRVIGKVPKIQFVRDRTVESWGAVEAVLKTADMGDDYVPKGTDLLKTEFGNEKVIDNQTEMSELPVMRQNVFGVDRSAIMNRIVQKMKSRPSAKKEDVVDLTNQNTAYQFLTPFNEEAFSEFLLKRKIMKEKSNKDRRENSEYVDADYDSYPEDAAFDDGDYLDEDDRER